ncbi:MAG: hypothetical protein IKC72_04785 [Clostridia bacterium]|nr:hypothetical protein [Clostridia bacterium]
MQGCILVYMYTSGIFATHRHYTTTCHSERSEESHSRQGFGSAQILRVRSRMTPDGVGRKVAVSTNRHSERSEESHLRLS